MRYLLLMLGLLCAHAWGDVALSPEQQAYVRAHPEISMCVDPDWAPFERLNARGEHEGIAADLLRLLASRAGLTLRIHVTPDWDASLAASKAGECQLLGFLNQSPDRDAWLLFTQPYFTDANVLISREEHPSVASLGDFVGARIALPSGTSVEEKLRRLYPGLQFVIVGSEAEALRLVNERQAEFTLRSLVMAADTIKNEGWFNLKIAGQVPELDNLFRIGVLRSEPMLRDILDQAIATLTPDEVNAIVNRYVSVRVETPVDYRLLLQVVAVFVLILASNLFWVVRLRRANRKLARQAVTDALTGLANRKQLNQVSHGTVETARRHRRPLAMVLLDIDHFKLVNDQHGHLVEEGSCASGAVAVHTQLHVLAVEKHHLGILAANVDQGLGLGVAAARKHRGGDHLLHKLGLELLSRRHTHRPRDTQSDADVAHLGGYLIEKRRHQAAHTGMMSLVTRIDRLSGSIEHDNLRRGRTNV